MDAHPLIIIGAGLAGWTTAREFRKLNATAPVLLVCADAGDFYAKPSLSNALAQNRTPEQLVSTSAAKMAQSLNLTLLPHTTVLTIDPGAQTIHTTQGDFTYQQLVLATGAQAIRVPHSGAPGGQRRRSGAIGQLTGGLHAVSCPFDPPHRWQPQGRHHGCGIDWMRVCQRPHCGRPPGVRDRPVHRAVGGPAAP